MRKRQLKRAEPVAERGIFVPDKLHKRLRVAAAECGRPVSELVRDAVRRYLEGMEEARG